MKPLIRILIIAISLLSLSLKTTNSFSQESTRKLKAILVVGTSNDERDESILVMKKMEDYLKSQGVTCYPFYNKKSVWSEIIKKSKGADFFIYSGHGNGSYNLCIEKPHFVSKEQISNDLKLNKNAVVLFKSVCYGAGSSAGDDSDIGIDEATRRVTNYARLFIEQGAACYYANNYTGVSLGFLTDFFEGKNIKTCFEESTNLSHYTKLSDIERNEKWSLGYNAELSIASSDRGGITTRTTYTNGVKSVKKIPSIKNYNIALVGNPEFNINKLRASGVVIKADKPSKTIKQTNTDNTKEAYHIIVASFTNWDSAYKKVQKLKTSGYHQAKMLTSGLKLRVAIKSYRQRTKASEELARLKSKFSGAWIHQQ